MSEPLKALSITPCWAHAIIYLGKRIENRTWQSAYRGPLLIHSSKNFNMEEFDHISTYAREDGRRAPARDEIPIGGIIGIVDFVDVVEASYSKWFNGPLGWVLERPRQLAFLPLKGQLGIFNVSAPADPKAWPVAEEHLDTLPPGYERQANG